MEEKYNIGVFMPNKQERKDMTNRLIQQKQLEDLLLSDDFNNLVVKANKFNIFNALKLENAEIKHSNFLGWLLTPYESHCLEDDFLKEVLKIALKDHTADENVNIKLSDVIFNDFTDADITLEKFTDKGRRIDIFIESVSNQFVCVIENKVWSGEGYNQLEDYEKYINSHEKYGKYKHKLFIFLTQNTDYDCTKLYKNYIRLDYSKICQAIDKVLQAKSWLLADDVKCFIENYKEMVERNIMGIEDKEIVDLCRKIYRKNKQAINLITNYTNITDEIIEHIQEIYPNDLLSLNKDGMFAIKSFKNIQNLQCGNSKFDNELILLQLEKGNKGYSFCLNVVPAKDGNEDQRKEVLQKIESKLGIKLKNSEQENSWSYYCEPIITEEEYYRFEDTEQIKNHLKSKIHETKFISSLQEIFANI